MKAKPLSIRFLDDIVRRLDEVARSSGLSQRASVIKFAVALFLDNLDKTDDRQLQRLLPVWMATIKNLDGRTHRYHPIVVNGHHNKVMVAKDGSQAYSTKKTAGRANK